MHEKIKAFIDQLKANPVVASYNEAETKQAIILPLLGQLGWDRDNPDELKPEYKVDNGKVDFSLRLNNTNEVFIEVKQTEKDLEKEQEQILGYSFRHGVGLAILTNGMTWWFFLPMKKGDWKTRKFHTIDIKEQETKEVASRFIEFLSKENIRSGKAKQYAESVYKDKHKKQKIEENLPEAWNKIISEPDGLLIDLLAETTANICGFKPDIAVIKQFIESRKNVFTVHEKELIPDIPLPPKSKPDDILKGERISLDGLIPHIKDVLRKYGGRASKKQVEKDIFQKFKDIFKEKWYQEKVSNNVPRWQHHIAWAKERAKEKGIIKWPHDSGRGYWELTESYKK